MIHTIAFLIGAIAAYWVYNDAKGRGHSTTTALLWALGTLAALIIFLPLYLIFGRKQPVRREEKTIDIEAIPVEERMCCPMCGSVVKEDFVVCPYCGHTLKPKCEKCGRELNRQWRACPYCDTPSNPK